MEHDDKEKLIRMKDRYHNIPVPEVPVQVWRQELREQKQKRGERR